MEEDTYRRGEKKTRGGPKNTEGNRVAEHQYRKDHLNRSKNEREERKDRAPPRKKDRYESD